MIVKVGVTGSVDPVQIARQFAGDIRRGLDQSPKQWPSHYFYDEAGWRYWQLITELPEYYLTRAENEIFAERSEQFSLLPPNGPVEIIELGAGCSEKTFCFLDAFDDTDTIYRPIDVSYRSLKQVEATIANRFPLIGVSGIQGTYHDALRHLKREKPPKGPVRKRIILFLGSNIGNMLQSEADQLLHDIRIMMRPDDHLIIGFDRFKDLDVMQRAYDDSRGVTAAFNLNLLARINRELGGTFDESAFAHEAHYDPSLKSMVSWLVAKREQRVRLKEFSPHAVFLIQEGEGIRTEVSRKYSADDITSLAERNGLSIVCHHQDEKRQFSVVAFKTE